MKKWTLALLLSSLAVLIPEYMMADDLEFVPGKQVVNASAFQFGQDSEAIEIRFQLFVPSSYDENKKLPLMLFLHGAGERGDQIENVTKWGPPRIVKQDSDFPFILISPQCPEDQRWNARLLARLVDEVAGELSVDKERMYCTGLSMGGFGTWSLLKEYPNLFAAAIPICGGGTPEGVEKYKHVPIWVFHGDADEVVPADRSREMVEALKAAGGLVKYTEYEGVGHNSWSETYANKEIYGWLLEQRRETKE